MPGMGEFAAALAIVLVAGGVSGLAGFGFGLVAVPPLLLLFEPASVVTMTKVLTLATAWVILRGQRGRIHLRVVAGLVPWAVAGMVVGIAVLKLADPAAIKLLASVVVVLFALVLLRGWHPRGVHSPAATALAGALSGTLSTSTGLSGPPVVMLFTARDVEPTSFRVTLTAYFAIIDAVGLGLLLASRSIDRDHLILAAALIPAAIAGRAGGRAFADRISPATFRRVTLALLLLTGATGILSALIAH